MSEFKDCPTIPELKTKLHALVGETKAQPMPSYPSPFGCVDPVGEGYAACVTIAKEQYEKAWGLVLELGVKKAQSMFEEKMKNLGEVADTYAKCSDPDHQCRREACTVAKRQMVDFENDRVALFQKMVRDMDASKEAFIEETKQCCEQHPGAPVEPPAGEGEGEVTDLTPGGEGETKPTEGEGGTATEEPTATDGTAPTEETPDQPF